MTFDPQPMLLYDALISWLKTVGGLGAIVLGVSLLSLMVSQRVASGLPFSWYSPRRMLKTLVIDHGLAGVVAFGKELQGCFSDLIRLSPRRLAALAKLTFMEAYRRKALAVFVVFALLFMFAGWFMGEDPTKIKTDQVKVYVSFVLRTISWLTLPMILILSSFGIPEDIRLRSIHTVVTKPASRLEIVLGRVIGFSAVGTLVLVVMSVVGWIWIVRQIPPSAKDMLICRVPVYGELKFKDRSGEPAATGINTGDVWEFRSYIEGATKARAIWKFQDVGEHTLDSQGNLHLENQFLAFRSYKGDMKRSLLYDYQFTNPDKGLTHSLRPHPVNENRGVTEVVSRNLVDLTEAASKDKVDSEKKAKYDLIRDFVAKDGSLTIEVSCIDREQYIGMARPDLFIRMPDRGFESGFFKAVLGIELMMILVVLLGVTASTFLKGPIASLLIFVLLILGGKGTHDFMDQLVLGRGHKDGFQGGGFFESIYRIVTHMNPSVALPEGNPAFPVMMFVDDRLTDFLWLCKQLIPRLQYFNMPDYVSNGFDVPFDSSLLPCLLITLGYMLPCVLLGYFALRIRELESK